MNSEKIPAESQLLARRLVARDEAAAAEIFRRYLRRLTALARARLAPAVGRRVDPEDAVQSAFRSFFIGARNGRFTIEHSGDLWRLLAAITVHKTSRLTARHRAAKRSVSRESVVEEGATNRLDFLVDRLPSPEDAAALADELTEIMQALPERQRRALQMRLDDAPLSDIAQALHCTERTVRRWSRDWQAAFELRLAGISRPAMGRREGISQKHDEENWEKKLAPPINQSTGGEPLPTVDYRDLVLQSHLGTGGMGRVYRAWQRSLDRQVAVKVLKKHRQSSAIAVERFLVEARLIASLDHPRVIRLHGLGRMPGGGYFFTMQLAEGGDLQQRIHSGTTNPNRMVRWMQQAAQAVSHAHARGVIHCDLKPSNLLLDRDDCVVVSDFGFAVALAGAHQPLGGTPEFIAPELLDARYGSVAERTDVWGLGAILYALLYGVPPRSSWKTDAAFDGFNATIDFSRPTPSPALTELCRRCLQIDSHERFAHVDELTRAIESIDPLD